MELGDVVLPPWAGGSPEECIRLHREALEGEVLPVPFFCWFILFSSWLRKKH